jgi:hypothetical protein
VIEDDIIFNGNGPQGIELNDNISKHDDLPNIEVNESPKLEDVQILPQKTVDA